MGTLGGHVLPGTFFIMFAVWWSFITSIRYIQSKMKSPFKKNGLVGFKSSVTMPCICLPCSRLKRAPIESYLKLILATIGLAGELITGLLYEEQYYEVKHSGMEHMQHGSSSDAGQQHVHNHTHPTPISRGKHWRLIHTNQQHSTMYSAFIFGAIVEILMYHRVDVPKMLDYAAGLLGFLVEFILFAFHLHGRDILDVHLHTLLVIAIFGCIVFCILEMWDRTQILFTYGRIAFVMLQGTWFYQVGFILYPPSDDPSWIWDLDSHMNIMTVTMLFCWHLMLIVIGLLIEMWIIKFIYTCSKSTAMTWDELIVIDDKNRSYITTDSRGHEAKFLSLNSDDDDDDDVNSSNEKIQFDTRNAESMRLGNLNDKSKPSSSNSSTSSGNFSAAFDKNIV